MPFTTAFFNLRFTRTRPKLEFGKVFQDSGPSIREHVHFFFWQRLAAVCNIQYFDDRTIVVVDRDRDGITIDRIRTAGRDRLRKHTARKRITSQISCRIDEMANFADDSSTAFFLVLRPMRTWERP